MFKKLALLAASSIAASSMYTAAFAGALLVQQPLPARACGAIQISITIISGGNSTTTCYNDPQDLGNLGGGNCPSAGDTSIVQGGPDSDTISGQQTTSNGWLQISFRTATFNQDNCTATFKS